MKNAIWFVFCVGLFVQAEVFATEWYNTQHVFGPNELPMESPGLLIDMYEGVLYIGTRIRDNPEGMGVAHIWRFDGNQWRFEQELVPSGINDNCNYGITGAIGDDVCIVCSQEFHDDYTHSHSTSAYVFEYDGAEWVETQKLPLPEDAGYSGYRMGIDKDVCAMPVGECVYIFRRGLQMWELEQKLYPFKSDSAWEFGAMCAIEDDLCVVTAPREETEDGTGVIYTFWFDGYTWQNVGRITGLLPKDLDQMDDHWIDISMSNRKCAVGLPRPMSKENVPGKVIIYDFEGRMPKHTLFPINIDNRVFGYSVWLDDNLLSVNSLDADGWGEISMYRFNGSIWQLVGGIPAENLPVFAVHDEGKVIVGAIDWWYPESTRLHFQAWQMCPVADVTGDCFVDLADFSVLASEWMSGFETWPPRPW